MTRPQIVIAHYAPGIDFFTDADLARISEVGDVLDRAAIGRWDDPRADDLLARADVVLGHWGCPPIDAAVLDRAPRLGLVAYAAGTVKGVVGEDVFARGIRVTSGAPANAEPVAEYALAMILLAGKDVWFRRELQRDRSIAAGRPTPEVQLGNHGRTIGLIGASLVGRRVIELLGAFPHLHVALYDPFVSAEQAASLGVDLVGDVDELCRRADVLSIHAPDLPSTRGMVGADQLALLRTGATVINTARPALLDQDALLAEVTAGRLSAVLDVTDPEPIPADHPLLGLPNVVVTPHLAGSEGSDLARMADHAADEIGRWGAGEPARNEITLDQLARLA